MKVLAISASPRRNANSETLLDAVLSAFKKGVFVKKIVLADLKIFPCDGCMACLKIGECVIKDDMRQVYEDLLQCDLLLVASPIYFQALPCQLKCVIDRCNALWARNHLIKKSKRSKKKRFGAAILVSGSVGARHTFTGPVITLKAWFHTLGVEYKKELRAEGLEEESAVFKNKKFLKKAADFERRFVENGSR